MVQVGGQSGSRWPTGCSTKLAATIAIQVSVASGAQIEPDGISSWQSSLFWWKIAEYSSKSAILRGGKVTQIEPVRRVHYKDTIETLTLHKNTKDMIMKSSSNEREEKDCTETAIVSIVWYCTCKVTYLQETKYNRTVSIRTNKKVQSNSFFISIFI